MKRWKHKFSLCRWGSFRIIHEKVDFIIYIYMYACFYQSCSPDLLHKIQDIGWHGHHAWDKYIYIYVNIRIHNIWYINIYCISITMSRNVTKHLNRSGSLLSKCRQLRSVVGSQLAERKNVKYQQDSKYRQKDTSSALSYILEESHKAPWHSTVSILFRAAARIRLRYYSIP